MSDNDRPARDDCEIEVTPRMIEAGEFHLYGYHPDLGVDAEETVRRIYCAMAQISRHGN